jgi:hypothetical protein
MKKELKIMNTEKFETYSEGVTAGRFDLTSGWLPENFTLDFIVNELRLNVGCSDEYLAGYLSVIFNPTV